MEDIIKIVTSLERSGLLLKAVNETTQNEVKEQSRIFNYVTQSLGVSLLGSMLADKGFISAGYGSKKSLIKDF